MLRKLVRPDPVQAAWRQFCRKLGGRGVARAPHEGPRDYAERASRALPAAREAIGAIATLYIGLRYGAEGTDREVGELNRRIKELQFG
jgi:hypothetical protein